MKSFLLCWLLAALGAAHASNPDVLVLCYHDVRDTVQGLPVQMRPDVGRYPILTPGIASHLGADQYSISTRNLAAQFDWLHAHGYNVISLQQLIDARTGHGPLPSKAVLLTFDDGLASSYTKVFPLLKAYDYHAVVAVVGAWADLAADGKVDYGPRPFLREDFASWEQLREMQDSGLVEIASHTYDLHRGIDANPQGNVIPAVLTHAYNPQTHRYETDGQYSERIRADLAHSVQEIREKLGRAPRALMWPYGGHTEISDAIAAAEGLSVTFTLGLPVVFPSKPFGTTGLANIPRMVMMSNPTVENLAWAIQHPFLNNNIRAVQVDLDYVYDPDPQTQERNLSALLDRIKQLGANQVWLQAFADPDGSGVASAVYFPTRHLPMRADLFSRVSWQLRTRCSVEVYAWMPVLAWRLPDRKLQAELQIQSRPGLKPENPIRLNPFRPETRAIVGDLYEDLGRAAPVNGILFSDDAILRDTDILGANSPAPGADRTRALIGFTDALKTRVRHWSPELATARNLFAEPVLHPASEAWYAQSLPAFLSSYDEVGLMAMPALENARHPDAWLKKLSHRVAALPEGDRGTVFELQTVNWRTKKPLPTRTVAAEMQELLRNGARHLAYYPDDFVKNNPDIQTLIPAFSTSAFSGVQP